MGVDPGCGCVERVEQSREGAQRDQAVAADDQREEASRPRSRDLIANPGHQASDPRYGWLIRFGQFDHLGQHGGIAQLAQALRQPAVEQRVGGLALADIRLVEIIRDADDRNVHDPSKISSSVAPNAARVAAIACSSWAAERKPLRPRIKSTPWLFRPSRIKRSSFWSPP